MRTPFFVLTSHGLEQLTTAETNGLHDVRVDATAYRQVRGQCKDAAQLLRLRTADDVFLQLASSDGIDRPRSTLQRLTQLAAELPLQQASATLAKVRPIVRTAVSVSASFVGKRNYSSPEIKAAFAAGFAQQGFSYCEDDRESDLHVRVFIEHERALIGARIGAAALHQRAYKVANLPGSLKPTVAAAMLQLATLQPGARVLDPCCGAGTIVLEAALMGFRAAGGDKDAATVAAALENRAAAELPADAAEIHRWDATQLPIAADSIDAVVCNLPWGKQVSADLALSDFYAAAIAEMARVIKPGGRVVLLTALPELLHAAPWTLGQTLQISLFGQRPSLLVFHN